MGVRFEHLSGDFEGYYYTQQKSPLSASESLPGQSLHSVHVYRGKLNGATRIPAFDSNSQLGSKSLQFFNLNDIELVSTEHDLTGVKHFDEILIKDPVVVNSWELNGKTYGILKGKALGKIKSATKPDPSKLDPQNIDRDKINSEKGDDTGSSRGDGIKNGEEQIKKEDDSNQVGSGVNRGEKGDGKKGDNTPIGRPGCLTPYKGCLGSIWNILKWILLLLLLYYLFMNLRSCWNRPAPPENLNSSCCRQRDSLLAALDTLKMQLDEVRNEQARADSLEEELERRIQRDSAQSGLINVSLMWQGTDDLDLALEQPNGRVIFFKQKIDNRHEAFLDVDHNRSDNEVVNDPIENVYINKPQRGRYKIYVSWFKNRTGSEEVPYTLFVNSGGRSEAFSMRVTDVRTQGKPEENWDLVYEFDY